MSQEERRETVEKLVVSRERLAKAGFEVLVAIHEALILALLTANS